MHRRIIDPDSDEVGEEVIQPTHRGCRQSQRRQVATPSQHMRIIDPDSYGDEEEVVVQPPRRQRVRQSQAAPSRSRNTRRQQQQHIDTVEEEEYAENVRSVPRRRATQSCQAAAASQRPRRHCQQRADTVEDNQHNRPSRQRTRCIFEHSDSTNKRDSVSDAVLAVFALSSKGPIKEADIKPLLIRGGRNKDWQDGLNELNKCLSTAFGYNLVFDWPSHQLFIKNDLTEIRGKINELYTYGTLQGIRIDNGSASARRSIPNENEFTEDNKKGLLFTILASIMMSSNAEMGHKMWLVGEDSLRHMCKAMKVPDEIFIKSISGNNAEFIRNGWIQKIEEKNANQDVFARYTWGPRAVTTLSTSAVFEKYCMVNKQTELEWGNYKEIFQKLDEKNGLYKKR